MKIFRTAIAALVMVAATATTAYARDAYSVGISVGSYGYPAPIGYSSNYSLGYSNYPNVVYYGAPVLSPLGIGKSCLGMPSHPP